MTVIAVYIIAVGYFSFSTRRLTFLATLLHGLFPCAFTTNDRKEYNHENEYGNDGGHIVIN